MTDSTLRSVIAAPIGFLAIGQFRVACEIVGDEQVEHRDDEQGADVERAEAAVNTVRDQCCRKRQEDDRGKP